MLGVTRQRVAQLSKEPGFPAPQAVLTSATVWATDDIRAWAKARGREVNDPHAD